MGRGRLRCLLPRCGRKNSANTALIASQDERRKDIAEGMAEKAAALGLSVAPDEGLLDEVTGLVEWPVPLIGRIDEAFMDLPPEVRELSMKINQKYFALRDAAGKPAPYFAFVANLAAEDGGAAIIAGNERVLRARLSDARHFWDLDLKTPLKSCCLSWKRSPFTPRSAPSASAPSGFRSWRCDIAEKLGGSDADGVARRNGPGSWQGRSRYRHGRRISRTAGHHGRLLCRANPAWLDGGIIGPAIKTHYQPKGPSDDGAYRQLSRLSVALADKLDTLREFFRIGEKPTGSGDPYALRRCALGVIRIILENGLRLPLKPLLAGDDGACSTSSSSACG